MTLALFAGTGALPGELARRLVATGRLPLVCELEGFAPDVPADLPRLAFRIETLGTLIATLRDRGITAICLAGAIRRPVLDPARIDAATRPLVSRLAAALERGDDGALRILIGLLEEAGLRVVAAQEIAPELLPAEGVPTRARPSAAIEAAARLGVRTVTEMGAADQGQACLVHPTGVIAREGPEGTDAMLRALLPRRPDGGGRPVVPPDNLAPDLPADAILFKAPKPGQDRRIDLPVIGPGTVDLAAEAGLAALVIEAGGVMVLDLDRVVDRLDRCGMVLWVRPSDAPP